MGSMQLNSEADATFVARRLGRAMVGLASAAEAELYFELNAAFQAGCTRTWGRALARRIFSHMRRR